MTYAEAEKVAKDFLGADWDLLTTEQQKDAVLMVINSYNKGKNDGKKGRLS